MDLLNELKDNKDKQNEISTDEMEEKLEAIKLVCAFIDELGAAFFDWVEPASKLVLGLIGYKANS